MIVLVIILLILLCLFLCTLLNVYVYASFDESLRLSLRIAFVNIKLLPRPKHSKKKTKKKKSKKKSQSVKKQDSKKQKEKISTLRYLRQKGLSGIINIIKLAAKFATGALKDLFERVTVTKFCLDLKIAGDDAADSAIKYGYCCSAIFPALRLIFSAVECKDYDVNINPDFSDKPKTCIKLQVTAKIRILSIITYGISKALQALRIYLKAKPKRRGE